MEMHTEFNLHHKTLTENISRNIETEKKDNTKQILSPVIWEHKDQNIPKE
jgi:hypothetical protein